MAHSAILLTWTELELPFAFFKTFVLSIFEFLLKTGITLLFFQAILSVYLELIG